MSVCFAESSLTESDYDVALSLQVACIQLGRRLAAELIGTAMLTFFAVTLGINTSLANISPAGNAIATGLTLAVLIYALGRSAYIHIHIPIISYHMT